MLDKETETSFLQTLLLAKATILSINPSASDVKDYNNLLKQYKESIFGITTVTPKEQDVVTLLNKLKGENKPDKSKVSAELKTTKVFKENIQDVSVSDFIKLTRGK